MHIKRVIVDNFVSYEHLELPSDLSKGLNLILGQNGSGKSNFHQGRYKHFSKNVISDHLRPKRCSLKKD